MGSTVASHEEHKEAGHSPSHFHTLAFDTTHFMQEEKENILLYFREKNNSSSAAVQPATRHVDKSRDQTNQYQNKRHRSNPSRASKKPPSPFRLPTKSNQPHHQEAIDYCRRRESKREVLSHPLSTFI